MIAFASLFLGLVLGVVPVKLAVGAQVTRVVLELDGELVGTLEKSPWSLPVDLGKDLSPHELVARAFDSSAREIGVVRQWLNLPGPSAKTEILLDRDEKGRATAARLIWGSVLDSSPKTIVVTFDGQPLAAEPSGRVTLPVYDSEKAHILTVDVEFSNTVSSHADVILGAGPSGEASELTALPVILPNGQRMPPVTDLQNWFLRKGKHLTVVGVENGPADILVVRGPHTAAAREHLGSVASIRAGVDGFPVHDPGTSSDSVRLRSQDRIRIAWPVARRLVGVAGVSELFEQSQAFRGGDVGFRWLLTKEYPGPDERELRFAEAVAVAGFRAFSGRSRRAVVLILDDLPDRSAYTPEMVRRYLSKIRVPLFVWSINSHAEASPWGPVEDISAPAKLDKAVRRLREELTAQRVIWLAGRYLPQQILLSSEARGIKLAQ